MKSKPENEESTAENEKKAKPRLSAFLSPEDKQRHEQEMRKLSYFLYVTTSIVVIAVLVWLIVRFFTKRRKAKSTSGAKNP